MSRLEVGSVGGPGFLTPGDVTIQSVGKQKAPPGDAWRGLLREAGDGLLSHNLSIAVPSALQGLTSVFGMGTGVAPAR